MESQGGQGQNQQGQQQYPIMAPPSSPAPQTMQHQSIHPPPISPAPHHPAYYGHHPSYPPMQPQQNSYYQNYYPQPHNQPQPAHYQHQQWGHHSYYPQQPVPVTTSHIQQSPYQNEQYPPQAQSPVPYQYVQPPRMHPNAIPPPPIAIPSQSPQPQHALMNLSRFVSQQSPCPSPGPHPHSPTTPVPLGSPHYPPSTNHMAPQPNPYHSSSQGHMLPNNNNNMHSSFHPPIPVSHLPQTVTHEKAESQQMTNIAAKAISSPVAQNNKISAISEQVQNSLNEISSTNYISNGGRSESNSPASSASSHTRLLSSPPPTSTQTVSSSNSNNGHMIPVRLQNMQKGARTKAGMRKLMQEQQISTVGNIASGADEGNPPSDNENSVKEKTTTTTKKSSLKSPRKSKKGAAAEVIPTSNEGTTKSSLASENSKGGPGRVSPAYSRKGKKMGRPSKSKSNPVPGSETVSPKKKGRKGQKVDPISETLEQIQSPVVEPTQVLVPNPSPKGRGKKRTPTTEAPVPVAVLDNDRDNQNQVADSSLENVILSEVTAARKKRKYVRKTGISITAAASRKMKPSKEEKEQDMELLLLRRFETPPRPVRSCTTKEQKKTDEKTAIDKSRQSRSKRGSVSYKEKSTSRSKSPAAEAVKKSPSPSKRVPVELASPSSVKNSPSSAGKSPKSVKTSPRLKEASPSPVRVRQLKEPSPLAIKRETRGSKEREEVPKQGSRKPKGVKQKKVSENSEPEIKTPPATKKKGRKSRRDTTPIRTSSPRLAKEQSVTSADTSPTPDIGIPTAEETEETVTKQQGKASKSLKPKRKSPGVGRKKVTATKPKKPVAAKKRKATESNLDSSIEEIIIPISPKKKPKLMKRARLRKKPALKTNSIAEEAAATTDDSVCSKSLTGTEDHGTSGIVDVFNSTPYVSINLDKDSNIGVVDLSTSVAASESHLELSIPMKPAVLESRRRSKSPRQSTETPSVTAINANTVAFLPPQPPVAGTTNAEKHDIVSKKQAHVSGELLSDGTQDSLISLSAIDSEPQVSQPLLHAPDLNSTPTAASARPKKPRKPRVSKAKNMISLTTTDIKPAVSQVVKPKKKTKSELRHLEFQQRKASLEVEVAQALLDMKHSSKSPSPVKLMEPNACVPETLKINATVSAKVTKPKISQSRPRKRKSLELDARPTTPVTSSIPSHSTLSPDISTPLSKPIKPKKSPKKARLQADQPLTSTPTILAVPKLNGNQGLNFSANSTISFTNTPCKTGPIKVAKTVVPPGFAETKASTLADIESTIASVSSGIIFPTPFPTKVKEKRKKKVAVKPATATTFSPDSDPNVIPATEVTVAEKPKRVRKKPQKKKMAEVTGQSIVVNNVTFTEISPESASFGTSPSADNVQDSVMPKPVKKKRASPTKPLHFKLAPKPMPVPTVFTTSLPWLASNEPRATGSDSKDKIRTGPSLKVIRRKVEFFRGGERDELDPEPSMPKRGQIEFDDSVPWRCSFCGLGSHVQKLGDLFGPYYPEKTIGSGKGKLTVKRETWIHGDCATWAGSMLMFGTNLDEMEHAIANASKRLCTTCGEQGATIGCLKRKCKQAVHFPCAVRKSWKLDSESFHSFCPAHIS